MNIIQKDGFAVRIPELPSRYRANCGREFGCFLHGETKGMNSSKAEKAGLTKGNFVEMTICWIAKRNLTFQPHYINESFLEFWGIPTAGEMKTQFAEKCSELSTFLIHRQSMDKFELMIEEFNRQAFNEWVANGMQVDVEELAQTKMKNSIFRFEFIQAEGEYGSYFYLGSSAKSAESDFERAAILVSNEIYQLQLDGVGLCSDERLLENEKETRELYLAPLKRVAESEPPNNPNKLTSSNNSKKLKSAN